MPSPDLLGLLRGGPTAPRVGEDVLIYRPLEGVIAIAVGGSSSGAAAVEAMRLRADGVATGPTAPACRVRNSQAISVPNATSTRLTFDAEVFDYDTMHDVATNTGRLTARSAGLYQVFGQVQWATGAGNVRRLQLLLSGADPIGADDRAPVGGGLATLHGVSTVWQMGVGDWVELWAYQDSGGALNVAVYPFSSPEFGMVRVG